MNIQIKLLTPDAKIPTRGSDFAAGYDLYTIEKFKLIPGERHLFKTGVSTAMPNGIYGRIAPRSGLAYKQGIDVMAGVIDSDYRGEIGVLLVNLGKEDVDFPIIKDGKETPIAQIIFEHHNEVSFTKTETLPNSVRGTGGFSSSDGKPLTTKRPEAPREAANLADKWAKEVNLTPHPTNYETMIREREKTVS